MVAARLVLVEKVEAAGANALRAALPLAKMLAVVRERVSAAIDLVADIADVDRLVADVWRPRCP